jgi:MFS transporter, FHS family, L-fucose permease
MALIAPIKSTSSSTSESGKNYTVPLIILTTLFFMWGFITCMNDILIPYLKKIFTLSSFEAGLIQSAFFGAYFVVSLIYFIISINVGDPISKIGYKNGIIVGLITAGIGCCLFYPAAEAKVYGIFLCALFILAAGITILQMAANPYVALLGKSETSSSRLNLTQAFNSLGTTVAPIIGGKLIFESVGGKENMTVDAVKEPYIWLGITLFAIAVLIKFSNLPKFTGETIEKGLKVLNFSHLNLGVLAIFMYVGGEVAIGSFLVNYFGEPDIAGWPEATAAKYVAFYWGGAMIGRFIGALSLSEGKNKSQQYILMAFITIITVAIVYFLMESDTIAFIVLGMIIANIIMFQIGKSVPSRTLGVFALVVIGLLFTSIMNKGQVAVWTILAIGLFNSIMFPTIFTLAIKDLGKYTSQGSSLLIMAIVGGAISTPLFGKIADSIGYQKSFYFPMICYLYICYYGFKGYVVKRKAEEI